MNCREPELWRIYLQWWTVISSRHTPYCPLSPARSGGSLGSKFLFADSVKIETTNNALPIWSERKIELKSSGRRKPEQAAARPLLSIPWRSDRCGTCKGQVPERNAWNIHTLSSTKEHRRSIPSNDNPHPRNNAITGCLSGSSLPRRGAPSMRVIIDAK